jgi:hypothetical protein
LGVVHSVRKVKYLREIGSVVEAFLIDGVWVCVIERDSLVAYFFNVE